MFEEENMKFREIAFTKKIPPLILKSFEGNVYRRMKRRRKNDFKNDDFNQPLVLHELTKIFKRFTKMTTL